MLLASIKTVQFGGSSRVKVVTAGVVSHLKRDQGEEGKTSSFLLPEHSGGRGDCYQSSEGIIS